MVQQMPDDTLQPDSPAVARLYGSRDCQIELSSSRFPATCGMVAAICCVGSFC
jgi:hypothetical protein